MIEIGKSAGFCGGVINSVKKAKEALNKYKNIYCLGELVHNKEVVESLEDNGLKIIDSLDEVEDESIVIIRAHGIEKNIYNEAKKRNIKLIDLTCSKVLKIHEEAEEYSNNNYFTILIGAKNHPEVIGTKSYCGENSYVIDDQYDIKECIEKINKSNINDVLVIAQTTYSKRKFADIVSILKKEILNKNIIIINTICNATSIRQDECQRMAKEKDCMIIIGGKNSSNTKKLYDIAKKECNNTFLIETVKDLEIEKIINSKNIGIMAGASTPEQSIIEVEETLKKIL